MISYGQLCSQVFTCMNCFFQSRLSQKVFLTAIVMSCPVPLPSLKGSFLYDSLKQKITIKANRQDKKKQNKTPTNNKTFNLLFPGGYLPTAAFRKHS